MLAAVWKSRRSFSKGKIYITVWRRGGTSGEFQLNLSSAIKQKAALHISLELGLTPHISYPSAILILIENTVPIGFSGTSSVKKLLLNTNTDIRLMHDASKVCESATSLLLSCVSTLSLLLGKLDYDFTRGHLLKFPSFPYCHKNSQKSNNSGKDKNGMNPFSILKQCFEIRFTYIYFH